MDLNNNNIKEFFKDFYNNEAVYFFNGDEVKLIIDEYFIRKICFNNEVYKFNIEGNNNNEYLNNLIKINFKEDFKKWDLKNKLFNKLEEKEKTKKMKI